MKMNNYVKSILLGLVCLIGVSPSTQAQWPTLDFSVITGEIQGIMQQIQQYKTQIMESKTVASINSAIGDAKSSYSKFTEDTIGAAKKKAEKLKAQADKVKKVQEDVKKAKEEYEKKKKEFDEYKQKLEEVKKEVTDTIQDAKDTVNEAKSTVNDVKNQVDEAKGTVAKAANKVSATVSQARQTVSNTLPINQVRQTAQTEGAVAGAQALNQAVNTAAAKNDTKTLDDIANLNPADIITSDSKIYGEDLQDRQGRRAFSQPETVAEPQLIPAQEEEQSTIAEVPTPEMPQDEPTLAEEPTPDEEVVDPIFQAAQQMVPSRGGSTVEEKPLGSIEFSNPDINDSEQEDLDAENSVIKPLSQMKKSENKENASEDKNLPAEDNLGRQPFQNQSWLDDGEFARQSSLKISKAQTLTFADVAQECSDYNNTIQNQDDGKIIILPENLAKYCCLKAEELTDLDVIRDCSQKLEMKMHDKDADISMTGNMEYATINGEQAKIGLVEVMDDVNKSASYKTDRMKGFMDNIKDVKTTRDGIGYITQGNIEILYLLNRIRRLYTTAAVSDGLAGLNNVTKVALLTGVEMEEKKLREAEEALGFEDDPDIGLPAEPKEYEASITRGDIKDYPLIPLNMAKKCAIKISEGAEKVRTCYLQAIKDAHEKDEERAKIGLAFIDSINYQDTLDVLAKSLYQKVKSATYDENLDKLKETNWNAATIRQNIEALGKTNYAIAVALDDIINAYANRLANKGLSRLSVLQPEAEKTTNTKTEG